MDFDAAVHALDSRSNYETSGRLTSPTLERMATLCDLLAHPERSFTALHITGTNGKTTTAHVATEVLRAAGLRVGTYTSAHVGSVRERVRIDGVPIAQDAFAEAWRELEPFLSLADELGDRPVTWFESMTALAFMVFADAPVEVAVLEVGMGGSWDATNVVEAPVAAFASIGLDHTDVLGPTVAHIAREKAGIVKDGARAYSLAQEPEALAVLRERVEARSATLWLEGEAFAVEQDELALGGRLITARIGADRYEELFLPLNGSHFARDAVLGAAAARTLLGDRTLDPDLLASAFAAVRVPGRAEVVGRNPLVVLDGAHNPPAARATAEGVRASFRWERLWLVCSVMEDKDVDGVVDELAAIADHVIATRNESPRAASTARIAERVRKLGKDATEVPNVADALSVALERASDADCVLVSGSLYTVGEARRVLVEGDR